MATAMTVPMALVLALVSSSSGVYAQQITTTTMMNGTALLSSIGEIIGDPTALLTTTNTTTTTTTTLDAMFATQACPTLVTLMQASGGFFRSRVVPDMNTRKMTLRNLGAEIPQQPNLDTTTATVADLKKTAPHILASLRLERIKGDGDGEETAAAVSQEMVEEAKSTSRTTTQISITPSYQLNMLMKLCNKELEEKGAITNADLEKMKATLFLYSGADLLHHKETNPSTTTNIRDMNVNQMADMVEACMPGNQTLEEFLVGYSQDLAVMPGDLKADRDEIEVCIKNQILGDVSNWRSYNEELEAATAYVQQTLADLRERIQNSNLDTETKESLTQTFTQATSALQRAKQQIGSLERDVRSAQLDQSTVLTPRPQDRRYRNAIRRCVRKQLRDVEGLERVGAWQLRCDDTIRKEHKDKIQAALTKCVKETQDMAPNDLPTAQEWDELVPMLHVLAGERYPCDELIAAHNNNNGKLCTVPESVMVRNVVARQSPEDRLDVLHVLYEKEMRKEIVAYARTLRNNRDRSKTCAELEAQIEEKLGAIKENRDTRLKELEAMRMQEEEEEDDDDDSDSDDDEEEDSDSDSDSEGEDANDSAAEDGYD
ncbi:SCP domain-containing protein [Pseudoscourfieldia marina]